MYVSRIVVRNFRNFQLLDVSLNPGATCLVGENNTGKTNLLHGIRLAIDSSLSSVRRQLLVDDFPVGTNIRVPQQVLVSLEFRDFENDPNQEAMVFGCHISNELARITYRFRPHRTIREAIANEENSGDALTLDDYRWEIRGGGDGDPLSVEWSDDFGKSVRFEDLQQAFLVITMEALRDVEQRLRQSRGSPLAKLLTSNDIPEEEQQELVNVLHDANKKIASSATIGSIGNDISSSFEDAAGEAFSMDVKLGMASPSFDDISRGLTVLLTDKSMTDFSPSQNGLGMNNILYISMLLEYFARRVDEGKTAGQLLLVEEPEAHLHPQLQRVLFSTLQEKSFQTILTTHSTHISSQAPLESLIVLTNDGTSATASNSPSKDGVLTDKDTHDLERYLDATRATLLYARKVILVEGPAELFLIPVLVKQVMGINLDEHGISVIPIYGVHFSAYAKLFGPNKITKKCAIIADGDLDPSDCHRLDEDEDDFPVVHKPDLAILENDCVKVFTCATTFELALANMGTLDMFESAAMEMGAPRISSTLINIKEQLESDPGNVALIEAAGKKILNTANRFGKARFAQVASEHGEKATWIPDYVKNAVDWLLQD